MAKIEIIKLGKRESQIMDAVYTLGEATAAEILELIPNSPSLNSVRTMLRYLKKKGLIQHRWDGPRYVYSPVVDKQQARKSALEHLKSTFFDGSTTRAIAALLDEQEDVSNDDLDAISLLIEEARKNNR